MNEMNKSGNLIVDLSFEFAIKIISFVGVLENNKRYVIAGQLLKSGTSIGANIAEAQHCESKADFIHKMKIAAKEANETDYWLRLCQYSGISLYDEELTKQLISIQKIISKIVSTSKSINK